MKYCKLISIGLMLVGLNSAFAHHSNTPFDMSRSYEVSGKVEKASFKNPHSLLTLEIRDGQSTQLVTFEGHSLTTLRHYGLRPSMVKIGEVITISYAPRRDDRPGGIFLKLVNANDEMLDFSNLGYD